MHPDGRSLTNHRETDRERSTSPEVAFCGNGAIVIIHDFFAQRQANPRTCILFFPVESLKHGEDFLFVLLIKSNSIIGKREFRVALMWEEGGVVIHLLLRQYTVRDI